MGEWGEAAKTLLRKEYADYSGPQADMFAVLCCWCWKKKKEIISKDHTAMYKQGSSLQNTLVVRPIKTVYRKRTLLIEEQP